MTTPSATSYDRLIKVLHWIVFLALFVVLLSVLAMDNPSFQDKKSLIMTIHKTAGIIVLLLMTVRLGWVIKHKGPRFLKDFLPEWQKKLENVLLKALYLFTFLPAITGWTLASSGPYPLTLFGLIPFPKIPLPDSILQLDGFRENLSEAHDLTANTLLLLVIVHVAISFWHHFALKDAFMFRIMPRATHKFLQRLRS